MEMISRFYDPLAAPPWPVTARSIAFCVDHSTDVAMVRREGEARAGEHGLDQTDRGRVALIITELGTNLLKHASGGEIIVSFVTRSSVPSVEVIAIDRGPGIDDVSEAFRDGHSSAGTPGEGLGAISRISTSSDLYSQPGQGTVVFAEVVRGRKTPASRDHVGGIAIPVTGEHECGDAWRVEGKPHMLLVSMADGLGHGALASEAATEALRVFRENAEEQPADILHLMHGALRSTRGAAVAIAAVDVERRVIDYAGIGNIAARLIDHDRVQNLVSMNGTVGHGIERSAKQFRYACHSDSTLVLHSDGVTNHWKLSDYPSLTSHHPSLIAAVLYRDHQRGRDDASIVVAGLP